MRQMLPLHSMRVPEAARAIVTQFRNARNGSGRNPCIIHIDIGEHSLEEALGHLGEFIKGLDLKGDAFDTGKLALGSLFPVIDAELTRELSKDQVPDSGFVEEFLPLAARGLDDSCLPESVRSLLRARFIELYESQQPAETETISASLKQLVQEVMKLVCTTFKSRGDGSKRLRNIVVEPHGYTLSISAHRAQTEHCQLLASFARLIDLLQANRREADHFMSVYFQRSDDNRSIVLDDSISGAAGLFTQFCELCREHQSNGSISDDDFAPVAAGEEEQDAGFEVEDVVVCGSGSESAPVHFDEDAEPSIDESRAEDDPELQIEGAAESGMEQDAELQVEDDTELQTEDRPDLQNVDDAGSGPEQSVGRDAADALAAENAQANSPPIASPPTHVQPRRRSTRRKQEPLQFHREYPSPIIEKEVARMKSRAAQLPQQSPVIQTPAPRNARRASRPINQQARAENSFDGHSISPSSDRTRRTVKPPNRFVDNFPDPALLTKRALEVEYRSDGSITNDMSDAESTSSSSTSTQADEFSRRRQAVMQRVAGEMRKRPRVSDPATEAA